MLVGVIALGATASCGGDDGPKELMVSGAWARTTPKGAAQGVVYFTITSPVTDAIVKVTVPADIAAAATLHETMGAMTGGQHAEHQGGSGEMTMTPLDAVDLPAKRTVTFAPGGKHVMLEQLAGPLTAGERFTLTLTLRSGASSSTSVIVADNQPGT